MPTEIAWHLCHTKLCYSRAVGEQEDRQISTCKLDPARAELSFMCVPEPTTIELGTVIEVSYLDIGMGDEHGVTR